MRNSEAPRLEAEASGDGEERPLFTFRCLCCGRRAWRWSPITNETANAILENLPRFRVFYFDRPTRGNLTIAADARRKGALIVFEPSSARDPETATPAQQAEVLRFREALELADIVKYSAERLPALGPAAYPRTPLLEIRTLGKRGLRYRRRLASGEMSLWTALPGYPQADVVDPTGAGDWLTAVLIHLAGGDGPRGLAALSDGELAEVLGAAQAAAAWTCGYMGARGGMYGDPCRKRSLEGTPAATRLEMVEAAISGEPGMEVLDVEVRDEKTAVRTPITMHELDEQYPDSQLVLYRGLDALHRVHRDCFSIPTLTVFALDRPGFELTFEQVLERQRRLIPVKDRILYLAKAFEFDASSTEIREAVQNGRPITGMVPPAVERIVGRIPD